MIEQNKLADWLSPVARRQRRFLLLSCFLLFLAIDAHIFPQNIPTLGIDFGEQQSLGLLTIATVALAYFLCSFFVYASSDWLAYKRMLSEEYPGTTTTNTLDDKVASLRFLFDYVLPLLCGFYLVIRMTIMVIRNA